MQHASKPPASTQPSDPDAAGVGVGSPSSLANPSPTASTLGLIGAVSHEMRNPLNGILGMAHLLEQTGLDAAQRSYLDGISASGEILLSLVNDLLDLTALQNGAIEPNPAPTDLVHLINQIVELAAPRAHGKGLGIGSMIDPALGASQAGETVTVELDGGRLRQILSNLLSNAIKFTDHGGVTLSARVEEDGADQSLVFDVRDSGHGIGADDQLHVFQPFGRTRSAQVAATEGTGLGLPLSRALAQALGGTLELAHSAPGKGTHMRVRLPLKDAIAPQGPRPLAGQTVLMALNPSLAGSLEAQALAETLQALGAGVTCVGAPDDFPDDLNAHNHLLVDAQFDHAMLWSRLRVIAAGLQPVVLLRPDNRHILSGLRKAGFRGYLVRPVRQSSLVAMLTHRFDESATPQAARGFLPDPADSATRPLNVLIAEDDRVNARLAQAALERDGHTVTVAGDGREALSLAGGDGENVPFDMVLLDLDLPVADGFAVAQTLRQRGYRGLLVACSGNTDTDLPERVAAAGFDELATKPLNPDTLNALAARRSLR